MKKFEYIERTFHATDKNVPVLQTLNDYGEYGLQVVSFQTIMYPLEPTKVWKYEVIFMKEK